MNVETLSNIPTLTEISGEQQLRAEVKDQRYYEKIDRFKSLHFKRLKMIHLFLFADDLKL